MEDVIIQSASAFFNVLLEQDRSLIFRGEGRVDWPLLCKVGRCYVSGSQRRDPLLERYPEIEITILEEFKRRSLPYIHRIPENDWEWLALAQHQGLPTRLLDWSTNPLVAAYFAIWENYVGDSVIYVCSRKDLGLGRRSQSPFSLDQDVLFEPTHTSSRITAQSSLFTVHSDPRKAFCRPSLRRLIIKQECLIELGIALEKFGMTDAILFPGMEGVSKSLKHKFMFYEG